MASSLSAIDDLIAIFDIRYKSNYIKIQDINYKSLELPPISHSDCNPIYNQCIHTNEEYIYITNCTVSGLNIYRYNINNNEWIKFYDFGYDITLSYIGNAIDSMNNNMYIIGKRGQQYSSHSLNTIFISLDLNSKQHRLHTIDKQYNVTRFDDMLNILTYIPSSNNDLHLLYSSSMHHIRINNNHSFKYKEYDGIHIDDTFNNGKGLRFAKCVYVQCMQRMYVFGGKAPKLKRKRDDDHVIKDKMRNLDKMRHTEIEIKSNESYCSQKIGFKSIWFSDIKSGNQCDYQWNIYKQRLPKKTRNFGVLNGFDYLIFLVYYDTFNSIWCLDLLNGDLIKSEKILNLNLFQKVTMVSTKDNYAHFMLINKDYGWIRMIENNDNNENEEAVMYYYWNKLTNETVWDEPDIWRDIDDDYIDPDRRCNFHISFNLLDVVPFTIKQRHKQRYMKMVQSFATGILQSFPSEMIYLIAIFTSALCQ